MQQQTQPLIVPAPQPPFGVHEFVEQSRRMEPSRLNGKEGPMGTEEWIAGRERI